MPDPTTQTLDPTVGTVPVTVPTQDACCQTPCDPPWRTGAACTTFAETKVSNVVLEVDGGEAKFVQETTLSITVTYSHTLCLLGKQHGGLAYTLTLLPGEKMTLYHSDRYRRTTTDTERYSVQTTFAQFVSALYQQQNSNDTTRLSQLLSNDSSGGGGGINLGLFSLGGSGSSSSSSSVDLSTQTSANQFFSIAQQAAQYTDLQRSITISNYEDSETVATTQRTLVNNNQCFAVMYFVRKVLDVYESKTTVASVTFQVTYLNGQKSPVLTPDQVGQVEASLRAQVEAALKGLPTAGEVIQQPTVLAVPTDGVVYDPELAHCCAQDPALEQAELIKLERQQAEAQKVGLEVQLMALEVQRRQALLAAGTLTPFEPAPTTTAAVA